LFIILFRVALLGNVLNSFHTVAFLSQGVASKLLVNSGIPLTMGVASKVLVNSGIPLTMGVASKVLVNSGIPLTGCS
jgi:hypothetical protein